MSLRGKERNTLRSPVINSANLTGHLSMSVMEIVNTSLWWSKAHSVE